jgi:hypothetical protein
MSFSVLATKQTWARQAREKECAHVECRRVAPPDHARSKQSRAGFPSNSPTVGTVAQAGDEWAPRQTGTSALVAAGGMVGESARCQARGDANGVEEGVPKNSMGTSPASSCPLTASLYCLEQPMRCPVDGVCCVSSSSVALNWIQRANLCGYSRRSSRFICSSSAPPIRTPAFPLRKSSCSDQQNAPKTHMQ